MSHNVRIIQGDGVNLQSIEAICKALVDKGWSIDNIAFGMGGALLQQVNRDTQQFAMKCSAIRQDGKWNDVSKRRRRTPQGIQKKDDSCCISQPTGIIRAFRDLAMKPGSIADGHKEADSSRNIPSMRSGIIPSAFYSDRSVSQQHSSMTPGKASPSSKAGRQFSA